MASVRLRGDIRLFILCCFAFFVCSRLSAQDSTYTFKSNVNVVLVPVLVRDKQGNEIGSLRKEDFQVFDNGKPQIISGFTIQKRAGSENAVNPAPPTVVAPTPHPPPVPERFIVFLFDDMHLSLGDLAQAQKAGKKILSASLTETDMAAVASLSGESTVA